MDIKWQLFPRNLGFPFHLKEVIDAFGYAMPSIESGSHDFESNKVLTIVCSLLESLGYGVEKSKTEDEEITVPVLFGENGVVEKFLMSTHIVS